VRVKVPREEWIEVSVLALVDPAVFEAAQAQIEGEPPAQTGILDRTALAAAGSVGVPPLRLYLLWKTAPQSKRNPAKGVHCYYRCIGTDGHRFDGHAVCDNPQVRGDYLEQAVWDRVRALLAHPDRVAGKYHRCLAQTQAHAKRSEDVCNWSARSRVLSAELGG
jgi:site-specific DNA recombinase